MLAKDVPIGQKFRYQIDLEPGETPDMLRTFLRVGVDKVAFPTRTGRIPVLDMGSMYVSTVRDDTDVEIIP